MKSTTVDELQVPPELISGLTKLVRATVAEALRADPSQWSGDQRVRHDRTALPPRSVLAAIRKGLLPAIKVGRYHYIALQDLERFYEAHRSERELGRTTRRTSSPWRCVGRASAKELARQTMTPRHPRRAASGAVDNRAIATPQNASRGADWVQEDFIAIDVDFTLGTPVSPQ